MNPWEKVLSSVDHLLERLPVVGGWIYRNSLLNAGGKPYSASIAFVPDSGPGEATDGGGGDA